ncbi:50S ribosomal protein L24 [Candidatus Pacearchaeota archaeon]|nr:50S ribosomal protein L24 [Candidatus Pacearchaeota archaeon]
MAKCTFCGREYEAPYGLTEFDTTGHTRHYCSSKCRKNFKMRRESDKVKWTSIYHEKKKAEKHPKEHVKK